MGTGGRSWWKRLLWIFGLLLVLVGGAAGIIVGPRWGALQCLLRFDGAKPPLGTLPPGMTLVEGPRALGYERALIARPDEDGARPVLVFVPGVIDEHGVRNPRVVQAADALRQGGHIVFVPEIVMFSDPGRPVDDLATLVGMLRKVADGAVPDSRKQAFGLAGVSLGGAFALRGLADFRRDGGRGCRAVLTIGAPGNLRAEAKRWFETPLVTADMPRGQEHARRESAAFGRNVLYRAALPTLIDDEADRAALKTWLDAEWKPKQAPEGLRTARAREVAASFLGGVEAWQAARDRILQHAWGRMQHSSPVEWRDRFTDYAGVPMFLMHGIHDTQISIASLGHLEMFLSKTTTTAALRSELIDHAGVVDVSLGEKFRHVAFLDDFFDMVGG